MIKEACENSLGLSRDILEAAVGLTPENLPKETLNITQLVSNSVELLNVRAALKNQKIVFESSVPTLLVPVNKEKIWRVFNNLISNAIKFSYENSTIFVNITLKENWAVIAIKDKGIGIPEKSKLTIFDMFTEGKQYGTSGEKPHGLGLSITLQVVKAQNGNIWFESEEGKGTTFYVELPINA